MKLIKVELQYEIQADGSSKTILTIDGQQESLSSSLGKGSREVSDFSQNFFPELVTYLNVGVNTSRITVFFDGDEESYRIFQNAYLQYYQENPELSISLVNKRDIDIPQVPQPTQEIECLFSNYSDDIKNKIEQYVRETESEIEEYKQYENTISKIISQTANEETKIINEIKKIKQTEKVSEEDFLSLKKVINKYAWEYDKDILCKYWNGKADKLKELIKSLEYTIDTISIRVKKYELPMEFSIFFYKLKCYDTRNYNALGKSLNRLFSNIDSSNEYFFASNRINNREIQVIIDKYNKLLETYLDTVQADLLNQLQEVSCNESKEMEKTKDFSDKFLYSQMDKTKEFLREIDDSIPVLKKQIVETFNEPRK